MLKRGVQAETPGAARIKKTILAAERECTKIWGDGIGACKLWKVIERSTILNDKSETQVCRHQQEL